MAPIIKVMQQRDKEFKVTVCSTGQHREMLDQVLQFFSIKPDYELSVMQPGQTLFHVTTAILDKIEPIIDEVQPDTIIVQGDTTTAFVGALAGYYKQVAVAHVEAGLRSGDIYSPFPEEVNRLLISRIAKYHLAPTTLAAKALAKESVSEEDTYITGNTVTDAILTAQKIVGDNQPHKEFSNIDLVKKIILVTAHRRESFGQGMEDICTAIKTIAAARKDVEFVFPVHLNPNVQKAVHEILDNVSNVHLIAPLDYPEMVWIMNKAYVVLTDSGGIQEEAPSLGKPVLVMREVTERMEGVDAGTALLVGTNKELIVDKTLALLDNSNGLYDDMSKAVNPYGDGHCAERIADILAK